MKRFSILIIVLLVIYSCRQTNFEKELAWWKDAHYGMFIHWGISSLIGEEISWSRDAYGAEKYDRLSQRFNPIYFDADKWIDVAENTGMKYIVLTSKHHDGFCLWDSKVNTHNIVNSPYGKDICKQLADAAHRRGMRLGWYFSGRVFNDSTCSHEKLNDIYVKKMMGEIRELLTNYGKIDIFWFDFEGTPYPCDPQALFDYCRKLQPDIIINNRAYAATPAECMCYAGSMGMFATPEQFVGLYGETPWETTSTTSSSRGWSIRFNDSPRPSKDLIWELISSAGGNGNLLSNVGPDSLGVIHQDFADTLAIIGRWITQNDGVLYGTKGGPWKPTYSYTSTRKGKSVNIILKDANDIVMPYNSEIEFERAYILSDGETITTRVDGNSIFFTIPDKYSGVSNLVIRLDMKSDADNIKLIVPFSTSGSLAYNKKVKASTALSETYLYNAESINDDNYNTRWLVGRRKDYDSSLYYGHNYPCFSEIGKALFEDSGTVEVDLEQSKDIHSFKVITCTEIAKTYVEYRHNQKWMTADVAENLKADSVWQVTLPESINARNWRLRISGGSRNGWDTPGIREFQLF